MDRVLVPDLLCQCQSVNVGSSIVHYACLPQKRAADACDSAEIRHFLNCDPIDIRKDGDGMQDGWLGL